MPTKHKATKLISSLLVISLILPAVLFSMPKKTTAQWAVAEVPGAIVNFLSKTFNSTTAANTTKDIAFKLKDIAIEVGKQALRAAAKRLLAEMTKSTINWINSGFHGSPLFLQNPDSFFRDIAKTQVKSLVDMIGYNDVKFPFGRQTALNVISSYKSQFEINAQYSLSKVINDPDLLRQYRNDFNYGGWNGFLINTQYPQNNYLGFNMLVQENLASRLEGTLQAPAQKVQTALQQGMGFLSPQTCPSNTKYNNGYNEFSRPTFVPPTFDEAREGEYGYEEEYSGIKAAAYAEWAEKNTCPGGLVSTTPGSVAANQIFDALNVPNLSKALDGAVGNSLSAILDALINKIASGILDKGGLSGLSNRTNPGRETDNWSYFGSSLSGNNAGDNDTSAGDLYVPDSVSATVDQETSIEISGGKAPYRIEPQSETERRIAIAQVSSAEGIYTLAVTGVAPGQISFTVEDSSTPDPKTATVQATINDEGALIIIPQTILKLGIGKSITTNIFGGEEPYEFIRESNEAIAITIISGKNLIIVGAGKGNTSVRVKDSSSPAKTADLLIEVDAPGNMTLPRDISTAITETVNVPISGGTTPYMISAETLLDSTIATAEIKIISGIPNLVVKGVSAGDTSIVIEDSSNPQRIEGVNIKVTDPNDPLGTCVIDGEINTDIPKSVCVASGGTWLPNP